jgi:uncharacterized membrane protein YgcG
MELPPSGQNVQVARYIPTRMGLFDIVRQILAAVAFLFKLAVVVAVTVVAYYVVSIGVAAGQIAVDPFGIAAYGLPVTVLGFPTTYAGGILLFDLFLLFGKGGSSGGRYGGDDDFDGGGGFGGDGGGGGGGGDE